MRRTVRVLGGLLVVAGAAVVLWAGTVWLWKDPFTSLYTALEQRRLSDRYAERAEQFASSLGATEGVPISVRSRRYRLALERGQPVGRIRIPRLRLDAIVVNGTDPASLKKGPGRDLRTFMPGEDELVYIAGHRTTYDAPFADIDDLRSGDRVRLELPYATFDYSVTRHMIVPADDVSRLESRGREELALQACHPRFFASHRYIAYARPVRVRPVVATS